MYFSGFFCPKQGQGFKPSTAHLYPNMGRVPPRGKGGNRLQDVKDSRDLVSAKAQGFHMIAAIAGKNFHQSLQLCGNHFLAIVTITAIIWKPAYIETA